MPGEMLLDPVDPAAEEQLHAVHALQLRAATGPDHQAVLPGRIMLLRADW